MRGKNTMETSTATSPAWWPTLDASGVLVRDVARSRSLRATAGVITADTEVLRQFTNLVSASDETIVSFASQHGFLGFCGHGVPATHPSGFVPGADDFFVSTKDVRITLPTASCMPSYRESLDSWRLCARRFRGLLRLGTVLRHDRADRDDWADVSEEFAGEFPPKLIGEQRTYLSLILSHAVRLADLRPGLRWEKNAVQPSFVLESAARTLFSPLVNQLLLAIAHVELTRCSNPKCGQPYWPLKKARADRGNFCPPCQASRVSKKLADARHERNRRRSRRGKTA